MNTIDWPMTVARFFAGCGAQALLIVATAADGSGGSWLASLWLGCVIGWLAIARKVPDGGR